MGRRKKRVISTGLLDSLKKDTLESIMAIIFIILAIFLLLSPWGKAGLVGDVIFDFSDKLFGVGYYVIIFTLISIGISFLKSKEHSFTVTRLIGGLILIICGIGIIELIFNKGGLVGTLISTPLTKLFDMWISIIGLLGGIIISTLIIFDTHLRMPRLANPFAKKDDNLIEGEEDEELKIDLPEDEEEDEDDEEEVPVKPAPEKKEAKPSSGLVFFTKKSSSQYKQPPLSLLERDSGKPEVGDIKANANIIKRTLANFGIQVEMDEVSIGPTVTRYALKPAEGVKLSKIVALQNDLALALAAHPLRIEAPIPGKSLVGIEIPNTQKTTVGLGSLFKQAEYQESQKPLILGLGKGVSGMSYFADLGKAPHMLIAGATGSGKSVTIHALITSLLFKNSPDMLKFIMVDPKRVELTLYNKIPHLLTPVITDAKKTILALKWAAKEMDRRYDILQKYGVRDITSYHQKVVDVANPKDEDGPETMPFIVIIIDELADIMQAYPRELEAGIVRLAQMSRAVGIHLIISTQRPSVNVITGLIKANIPTRVALQVASQIDSRTILDMPGAEKLLGQGDMLYLGGEMNQPRRVQSAFISEEEVKKVANFLAKQYEDELPESEIDFEGVNEKNNIFDAVGGGEDDASEEDDLYPEAKEIVINAGKASTSYLQRKLGVGYSRAAKLIDLLEDNGVVGPANGSKPRDILVGGDDEEDEDEEYE